MHTSTNIFQSKVSKTSLSGKKFSQYKSSVCWLI